MSEEIRGYPARIRDVSVDTTGVQYIPLATTAHLQISNDGAEDLRVFLRRDDFDADANFITLVAGSGFFKGPLELGPEPAGPQMFLKAVAGTATVQVIEFYRRS